MASSSPDDQPKPTEFKNFLTISRFMRPDDANNQGNVHGGVILKMIEEIGAIISTKYCNYIGRQLPNYEECVAALARVEKTNFLLPMFIGEVSMLEARITYTSPRSVEVSVDVWAENVIKGEKRLTNRASLWYVPLTTKEVRTVVPVPKLQLPEEEEKRGTARYEQQKFERHHSQRCTEAPRVLSSDPAEEFTVDHATTTLAHLIGQLDCNLYNFVQGGVMMKLMDECAGIATAKHCKTNVVTVSVDAINFSEMVPKGSLLTLTGRPTFASNKSLEIEVIADAEVLFRSERRKFRAAAAFFTFVSLDKDRRPIAIPPLQLKTDIERKRSEEGKQRYERRKQERAH